MSGPTVPTSCGEGLSMEPGYAMCNRPTAHEGDHGFTTYKGVTWTWPQGVTEGKPVREGCRAMNRHERLSFSVGRWLADLGHALMDHASRCQREPKGGVA